MRALIVESSKLFQELVCNLLEDLGCEVDVTASGETGVAFLETRLYDVVIVTMFLEDMTGTDFCMRLRCDDKNAYVPVFMLTSSRQEEDLQEASSSGVTEIFHKDDLNRFSESLRNFTERLQDEKTLAGRVLLVLQDVRQARDISQLLETVGLEVVCEGAYETALGRLHLDRYELVLVDGEGSDIFIREIRASEENFSSLPIIALSGVGEDKARVQHLVAGATELLSKPVLKEALLTRVSLVLTNKKLAEKNKQLRILLYRAALADPLTFMHNRQYLMEVAPKRIKESYRHAIPLCLLTISIDQLKETNKTEGQFTGDMILAQVGTLLKKACRTEDIGVRFGGGTFLLILSHCTAEQALKKAEDVRSGVEVLKPAEMRVTVSIGVASLPLEEPSDFSDLFCWADNACTEAKEREGNCVVQYQVTGNKVLAPEGLRSKTSQ